MGEFDYYDPNTYDYSAPNVDYSSYNQAPVDYSSYYAPDPGSSYVDPSYYQPQAPPVDYSQQFQPAYQQGYQAPPPDLSALYTPAPSLTLPIYGGTAPSIPSNYYDYNGSQSPGAETYQPNELNNMWLAAGYPGGTPGTAFSPSQYDQAAQSLVSQSQYPAPSQDPSKGWWGSMSPGAQAATITAGGGLLTGLLAPLLAAAFRPKPTPLPTPAQLGIGGADSGGSESSASSHPHGLAGPRELGGYLGFPGVQQQFTGQTQQLQAERQNLPTITQQSIITQAQSLFDKVLSPQIIADSNKRIAQINELANKLGLNAAGPIAQEMDNRSRQLDAARAQSQQTALAYAQALISAGNARLASGLTLAGLLNPAQYAGALASSYTAPDTESQSSATSPA